MYTKPPCQNIAEIEAACQCEGRKMLAVTHVGKGGSVASGRILAPSVFAPHSSL